MDLASAHCGPGLWISSMASAMRIHLIQPSISAHASHVTARLTARATESSADCAIMSLADRQISTSVTTFKSASSPPCGSSDKLVHAVTQDTKCYGVEFDDMSGELAMNRRRPPVISSFIMG
jgi:hypothetical protein